MVMAIATALILRQKSLIELRDSNARLRQQLDSKASVAHEPVPETQSTNSLSQSSSADQDEISQLRQQIPLLQLKLEKISNEVAALTQPVVPAIPSQPENPGVTNEETNQMVLDYMQSESTAHAGSLASALKEYLKNHGELPPDLSQLDTLTDPELRDEINQRFELMRSGTIPEADRPYTYIAREKEPTPLADGNCMRIYITADGGEHIFSGIGGMTAADWEAREHFEAASTKMRLRKEQLQAQP